MKCKLIVPNTEAGAADVTPTTLDGPFVVEWVPGNGTHYRLLFVPLTPEAARALGYSPNGERSFLVNWGFAGETGFSYVFSDGGFISLDYIREKLFKYYKNVVDASEIARIISAVLGRETNLCTDRYGRYNDNAGE